MRKVSLYITASQDGQIAHCNGSIDRLSRPGKKQDYGYADFIRRVDTLVMGRKTYDQAVSLGNWPCGDRRSVVLSRNDSGRREAQAEFVAGDIAGIVKELRTEPGRDIWLVGGGEVVSPCLAGHVIDEIILSIPPFLLGDGIPLFLPRSLQTQLHLRNCHAFPGGLVQLSYDVLS